MAYIEIKDLTFKYKTSDVQALSGVNLAIDKGEIVIVCGKTGSGKSTLLYNLKKTIRPAGELTGDVIVDEKNLNDYSDRGDATHIGFVFQQPDHQIVTDKVWHELAFGLENLGMKSEDIRLRVAEISEYFGITEWYEKKTSELSGGQKQILNLAAVMVMGPEILLLDEPTAQLDTIAEARFLELLKKINEDMGVTIIMTAHRMDAMVEMADKLTILKDGKVVESGEMRGIIAEASGEEEKLMPTVTKLFKENGGEEDLPITISELRDKVRKGEVEIRKKGESVNKTGEKEKNEFKNCETAVKVKNVFFRYKREDDDVLRNLSLEIKKGEVFGILGGNGTGKTTLLSVIKGIRKAYRGKVKVDGKVGLLPQDVQTLFSRESVEEELDGVPEKIIEQFGLGDLRKIHPYDLSGGQQQKLALAKVMSKQPDILLLDEPTKGLDAIAKEELLKIVNELKRDGKTIIIVSHDIDFCGVCADRCGLFAQGSVIAIEESGEFFANAKFYTTTEEKVRR